MNDFMPWALRIFGLIFIIMGIYSLAIGLRGFIRKKPFLVAARQHWWLTSFSVAPAVMIAIAFLFFMGDLLLLVSPLIFLMGFLILMLGVVIVFTWKLYDGYTIYGVTDESFRAALVSTLTKLNVPYEETISRLRLTEINADLQATVVAAMGTGQLRIKPKQHNPLLKQISDGMNEYYKSNPSEVNQNGYVFYTIIGLFCLIVASVLGLWFPSFFNNLSLP
jgi:hypothetical protein